MKTNSGFDSLAWVYDILARLVFGKSIVNAQTHFLNRVPENTTVLILGGGTGWLLKTLIELNSTCQVWYIESSLKMLERSRQQNNTDRVHFIMGTEESIPHDLKFDVVITNFYLDMFSNRSMKKVLTKINAHATPSALLFVADFVSTGVWWQVVLLKIMYCFFNQVCNIEARTLPEWNRQVNSLGWTEGDCKFWYGNFIKSCWWHRPVLH